MTDSVIDIAELLKPISNEHPAGTDIQFSSTINIFGDIEEARREEESRDQGQWETDNIKTADWRKVVLLSVEALTGYTKDLRICAFLIEALIKQHSFVGLRDGLQLFYGLLSNYWENCYPAIDQDDEDESLTERAACIKLIDRFSFNTLNLPLIVNVKNGIGYSYNQWKQALSHSVSQQSSNEEPDSTNKLTREEWQTIKNATSIETITSLNDLVKECIKALSELTKLVDEKFGNQAPGLNNLNKALSEISTLGETILKEKGPIVAQQLKDSLAKDIQTVPMPNLTPSLTEVNNEPLHTVREHAPYQAPFNHSNNHIENRKQAFRQLTEIAEFFRVTEPHNPAYHFILRAIKWGQMPIEELMKTMFKNSEMIDTANSLLAIDQNS